MAMCLYWLYYWLTKVRWIWFNYDSNWPITKIVHIDMIHIIPMTDGALVRKSLQSCLLNMLLHIAEFLKGFWATVTANRLRILDQLLKRLILICLHQIIRRGMDKVKERMEQSLKLCGCILTSAIQIGVNISHWLKSIWMIGKLQLDSHLSYEFTPNFWDLFNKPKTSTVSVAQEFFDTYSNVLKHWNAI